MSEAYERYKEFSKDWNYNSMAPKYDEESETLKCRSNIAIASFVCVFFPDKNARILDIAAGTGRCGESLKSIGYKNLDGLEPVESMFEKARLKSIYTNYFHEGISEDAKTSIPDNSYDVAISAGAFAAEGHIQAGGVNEFLRIVKPGGMIFITFRNEFLDIYKEFTQKFNKIIDDGEKDGRIKTILRCVYPEFFISKEGFMIILKKLK